MIRYKLDINVLQILRDNGYTSYNIRRDKLLGERCMQKLREGVLLSWHELDGVCRLTGLQPGDIVEYVSDNDNDNEEK